MAVFFDNAFSITVSPSSVRGSFCVPASSKPIELWPYCWKTNETFAFSINYELQRVSLTLEPILAQTMETYIYKRALGKNKQNKTTIAVQKLR